MEFDDATTSDGFGPRENGHEKRLMDTSFDYEPSAATKRAKLLDDEMAESVNQEWLRLVDHSAKRVMGSSLTYPWEKGIAAKVLNHKPVSPPGFGFPALTFFQP